MQFRWWWRLGQEGPELSDDLSVVLGHPAISHRGLKVTGAGVDEAPVGHVRPAW
jgi:hypothetical protein